MRPLAPVAAAAWVAVLGPGAVPSPAAPPAAAAVGHRAAVIVDTGSEVKSVCVRFQEESLTGIEALSRAAVDPVLRAFAGKGAAVCSLCGTGCPGDESCLTCDAGGRFWSYSRAPAGTDVLRTSGAGASTTTVRDGDVEGWRWGRGAAPPFATVEQVCGEVAAATTTTAVPVLPVTSATSPVPVSTAAPRPGAAPASGRTRATSTSGPLVVAVPGAGGTAPATGATPAHVAPSPGDDTATTEGRTSEATGALGSSPDDERDTGGSGWAGLAGFAAALSGLAAWAVRARRRRAAPR